MTRLGEYEIDDDRSRIDLDALYEFLSTEAYWSRWRTEPDVAHQLESAWRVVGCYHPAAGMVGFARAVSDGLILAYLADVYVLPDHRGHKLGEALVAEMVDNGPGKNFRWMLHTSDAHGLYAKFGFAAPDQTFMERPAGPPPAH
jgi:GNAT superfamily N-acetyltransferase